jgi:hypothetical protein
MKRRTRRLGQLGQFHCLGRRLLDSGVSALAELDASFVGFLVLVGLGR